MAGLQDAEEGVKNRLHDVLLKCCTKCSGWIMHSGDTPEDTRIKRALTPVAMGLTLYTTFFIVTERDRTFEDPWIAALACFTIGFLQFFVRGLLGKSMRTTLAIYIAFATVAIVLYDIHLASLIKRRAWSFVVLALDLALVFEVSSVIPLTLATTLIYLLVERAESAFRFGLYDLVEGRWDTPEVCECANPPCAYGVSGLGSWIGFAVVLLVDFHLTRGFAYDLRHQLRRVRASVEVAAEVASALAKYDIERAESYICEDTGLPDELKLCYQDILSNLRGYRAYLPEALIPRYPPPGFDPDGPKELMTFEEQYGSSQPTRTSSHASVKWSGIGTPHPSNSARAGTGDSVSKTTSGLNAISSSRSRSGELHVQEKALGTPAGVSTSFSSPPAGFSSPRSPRSFHEVAPALEFAWAAHSQEGGFSRGNTPMREVMHPPATGVPQSRKASVMVMELHTAHDGYNHKVIEEMLGRLIAIVAMEAGCVLSFNSNDLTCAWNAHRPCPRHGRASALCGLAVQRSSSVRRVTCGLAAGTVAFGMVGTSSHKAPFVCGLPLVHARQLSVLAGSIGARVLASEAVQEMAQGALRMVPVDVVSNSPDSTTWVFEIPSRGQPGPRDMMLLQALRALREGKPFQDIHDACKKVELGDGDCVEHHAHRIVAVASEHPEGVGYTRRWMGWENWGFAPTTWGEGSVCGSVSFGPGSRGFDGLAERAVSAVTFSETPRNRRRTEIDRLRDQIKLVGRERRRSASGQWSLSSLITPGEIERRVLPRNKSLGHLADTLPPPTPEAGDTPFSTAGDMSWGVSSPRQHASPTMPGSWKDGKGDTWRRSDQMLGKGCFGVVWLGMSDDGNLCAIKALGLSAGKSQAQAEATLNEVEVMLKLRHDNIVCYLSSAVCTGYLFICLEYVPGGSLEGVMTTFKWLGLSTVQRYAKGIMEGLVYLHRHKVAHRDFKPANVLLQIEGLCKLSDFGASSELRKIAGGEIVGTPMYMAPEACTGQAALPADIWSFGITLHQMLTTALPYEPAQLQLGPTAFMYNLGKAGGISPVERPFLAPQARELLQRCWKRDPKDRPLAREVLDDAFFFYSEGNEGGTAA
eukprot:Hpha_TRINITY_DN16843_c1_g1::TRINITY_DN16843_c1_g1_i16::g.152252::m.152252